MKKLILIGILIIMATVFAAAGDPTKFGNSTTTTCWLGGTAGIMNCTGQLIGRNLTLLNITCNSTSFLRATATGVTCVDGIQGPQGPQGNPGSNGAPGSNGSNGVNGTVFYVFNSTYPATPATNDYGINNSSGNYYQWNGTTWNLRGNLMGPQGIQGNAGAAGSNGTNGAPGQNGTNGSNGTPGTNGTNGVNGTNGTRWYVNTTFPGSPATGDMFLNNSTGLIYRYNGTAWGQDGNLTGPQGVAGAAGTNGTNGSNGAPGTPGTNGTNGSNGAAGINGTNGTRWTVFNSTYPANPATNDLALNNSTDTFYSWNGTAWISQGSLRGATGSTGAAGTNGTNGSNGAPGSNGTNGVNGTLWSVFNATFPGSPSVGDLALNNSTGIYYKWNGTVWNIQGNLTGATGAQGTQGNPGAAGSNGTNGSAGANGLNGTNGTKWTVNTTFPANPAINDLMLNNSTGLVYAWNGTVWNNVENLTGPQGIQGNQGNPGTPGTNGTNGAPGTNGTNGVNGTGNITGSFTTNRIPYATNATNFADTNLTRASTTVITPDTNNSLDWGSATLRFKTIYAVALNFITAIPESSLALTFSTQSLSDRITALNATAAIQALGFYTTSQVEALSNLTNYYTKTNTYNKTEANSSFNFTAQSPLNKTGTTFGLNNAGSAGTYGGANQSATCVFTAFGLQTSCSNTSIALDASAITSGILAIARGGTNAIAFGSGGILFFDGTKFANDTLNFFYNATSDQLFVGTNGDFVTTARAMFYNDVESYLNQSQNIRSTTSDTYAGFSISTSRGNGTNPLQSQPNDFIGGFRFYAANNSSTPAYIEVAAIWANVTGNGSSPGAQLFIGTKKNGTVGVPPPAITVNDNGNVSFANNVTYAGATGKIVYGNGCVSSWNASGMNFTC